MTQSTRARQAAPPRRLSEDSLAAGLRYLRRADRDLARLIREQGPPPLWAREEGFPTLVQIILEQQVSLASARAAFDRLKTAASPLTPERLLALDDAALRLSGFSRQKSLYVRHLARLIIEGRLDLQALNALDDERVGEELRQVKGIGRWTADIYMLMAMGRLDVWPSGDLALAVAAQKIKGLAARPSPDRLDAIAEPWRPWRALAARVLWQFYLSRRG